jgi:hypothetical protein
MTNPNNLRLITNPEYGADSLTKREATPYQFDARYERALVYLLCTHRRFYDSVGSYLDYKLLGSPQAKLLVEACQLFFATNGHAPQSIPLVLEALTGLMRDGRVQPTEIDQCEDYLAQAEEDGLPPWEDVRTTLEPTLLRRLELDLLREARDAYSKRSGQERVSRVLKKIERLGVTEERWGTALDESVIPLIEEFRAIERLPCGMPPVDKEMRGGFLRGTTTVIIGGTGTGKSASLIMLAANATVLGYNVSMATLELAPHLQQARYLACLSGWLYDDVLNNPRAAYAKVKELYPYLGLFKVADFSSDPYLQSIFEWEDREDKAAKEKTGKGVEVRLLDYFNLIELLDDKGKPSQGAEHRDLSRGAKMLMTRSKELKIWNFTAAAPTKDEDKPKMRDKDGKFPFSANKDIGGAYGIPKAVDTVLFLQRVLNGTGEDPNDFDLYPLCTKDRHGASGRSAWVGEALYQDFTRIRVCGNPSFVPLQKRDPLAPF